MGLRQRHVVILMYAVTLLAASLGAFMMITRDTGAIVILGCVLLLLVLLFRAVGAIRLRESVIAFRHNICIARQANMDKRAFEQAQLRLREAGTFQEWWGGACDAGKELGFRQMSLRLIDRQGVVRSRHSPWGRVAGQRQRIARSRRQTSSAVCPSH